MRTDSEPHVQADGDEQSAETGRDNQSRQRREGRDGSDREAHHEG